MARTNRAAKSDLWKARCCLAVPHRQGHGEGTLRGRGVLLGVRRSKRPGLSERPPRAGKGREAATWVTSVGGGHDEEERDQGNQAGGTYVWQRLGHITTPSRGLGTRLSSSPEAESWSRKSRVESVLTPLHQPCVQNPGKLPGLPEPASARHSAVPVSTWPAVWAGAFRGPLRLRS